MPTFIESEMRRTNRNLLFVNVAIVVVIGGAMALGARYFHNFFAGPASADAAALAGVKDPAELERSFVRVEGKKVLDTGAHDVATETRDGVEVSRRITCDYWLLLVGERALIVRAPNGTPPSSIVEGEIVALPDQVRSGFLHQFKDAPAGLTGALFPLLLDASSFRAPGFAGLSVAFLLLALAAWNLVKWSSRRANPAKHPIVRELERHGSFEEVATALELEVADSCRRIRAVRITRSWLLHSSAFRLATIRLADVLWTYKHVIRHLVSFVPVAKTVTLQVHSRGRRVLSFPCSMKAADQIVTELAARIPWSAIGFNPDLKKLMRKNPAGFVAAIEERRKAYAATPAAPADESVAGAPR